MSGLSSTASGSVEQVSNEKRSPVRRAEAPLAVTMPRGRTPEMPAKRWQQHRLGVVAGPDHAETDVTLGTALLDGRATETVASAASE